MDMAYDKGNGRDPVWLDPRTRISWPATGGVRRPGVADGWLVPPWRDGAELSEVVLQFSTWWPPLDAPADDQRVFYLALSRILEEATPHPDDLFWFEPLRDGVRRCMAHQRGESVEWRSPRSL
jgi:hypothetical protein